MIPLALEGRQVGRRPTESSVMRVQRKFVEEMSGNEEGVVEEVKQEGTKEEELQVNNYVFFLPFLSAQNGLMEMDNIYI